MVAQHIDPLLKEYDDLVSSLQCQINVYDQEHGLLRQELLQLLADNAELQKKVDDQFQSAFSEKRDDNFKQFAESEMVSTLRKQLEISLSEREQLSQMYKSSQELVLKLEKELSKARQVKSPVNYSGLSNQSMSVIESKLEELSLQIKLEKSAREDVESVNLKLQTEAAKLKINLESKLECLKRLEDEKRKKDASLKTLEQETTVIRKTLKCISETRDGLELEIVEKERLIRVLQGRAEDAKAKVEEAIEIAEKAINERDSLQQRLNYMQAEIQRLEQSLSHVMDDAALKLQEKLKDSNEKYEAKLTRLVSDFDKTSQELKMKEVELIQVKEQHKNLEHLFEIQKQQTDILSATERDVLDLQSRLAFSEEQLREANIALSDAIAANSKMEENIERMRQNEANFMEIRGNSENVARNCKCEKLRLRIQKLKEKRLKDLKELEERIVSQLNLNEKWQAEAERLAKLLEKKTRTAAKDMEKMRLRYKALEVRLMELQSKR